MLVFPLLINAFPIVPSRTFHQLSSKDDVRRRLRVISPLVRNDACFFFVKGVKFKMQT